MDDTAFRRYFTHPAHICHRQYEALRAVVLDGRSQKDVAEAFGLQYDSFRQLMHKFRRSIVAERQSTESPFFKPPGGISLSQARRIARPRLR
jgi:transposase